jgi:hypothetical protein
MAMITRTMFVALLLCVTATLAKAECNIARANVLNDIPLPEKASEEFDSKVTARTDGAQWSFYKNKSGNLERAIHTDYGESGRDIRRLTISDATNYIVTVHHFYYLAPLDVAGSVTHREELDHYWFCDAKLELPKEWDEYDKAYLVEARKAADFFFQSDEIKKQLKSAGLKPPIWK